MLLCRIYKIFTIFEVAGFIYYGNMRESVIKRQIRFLSHPLGDFLLAIIELFSLGLTADALISYVESVFVEGGGSLWAKY